MSDAVRQVIVDDPAAPETLFSVADRVEEETRSRKLVFDPFTLNGTAETPIFLVPAENLRDTLLESSRDGWIERLRVCSGSYSGLLVYSFTEEKLRQFIKLTHRIVATRYGSNIRHVELVSLGIRQRMPAELADIFEIAEFPEYQIEDTVGLSSAMTTIAATILGPLLKRKIIFTNNRELSLRGGFQICILREGGSDRGHRSTYRVFGIRDANQSPLVVYTERQKTDQNFWVPIRDDYLTVAELYENGAIILSSLGNTFQSIRIFHRVMVEIAKYLGDPEGIKHFIVEQERLRREKQRQHVINCASQALNYFKSHRAGRDLRATTTRSFVTDKIAVIQQQIFSLQQQLIELNQQIFAIENEKVSESAVLARINHEFERLITRRIAYVDNAFFTNDGDFHVITESIIAHDRGVGRYHLLGPCEIIITFPNPSPRHDRWGIGGGIRILQKTSSSRSHRLDLPHCRDGVVCFGNISHEIAALIGGFEIEALVSLVITFLLRPNTADADGARVRNFPVVEAPSSPTSPTAVPIQRPRFD